MQSTHRTFTVTAIIALVIAGFVAPIGAVGAVAAQSANQTTQSPTQTATPTATQTATPTETACEPRSNAPEMEQARLHARNTTIAKGQPGSISGGFQVSPTASCPIVVHITMSVPSGMYISGGSDMASGGAGMISTQFVVRPGASIKDIRAEVYASNSGQATVTADITYWPQGHKDMAREIDGLSFTYDVQEAYMPSDGSGDSQQVKGGFPLSKEIVTRLGFIGLVAIAIIGLVFASRNDVIINELIGKK